MYIKVAIKQVGAKRIASRPLRFPPLNRLDPKSKQLLLEAARPPRLSKPNHDAMGSAEPLSFFFEYAVYCA